MSTSRRLLLPAGLGLCQVVMLVGLVAGFCRWLTAAVDDDVALRLAPDGAERLLADLHRADGLFDVGEEQDLGVLVNDHLLHDLPVVAPDAVAWWSDPKAFEAFEPLRKDGRWLDAPAVVDDYDLSFLAQWRAYDHWDWWTHGPLPAYAAAHPEGIEAWRNSPHAEVFQSVAAIRLAQGLRSGDLSTALTEVHHLASLLWSSEDLMGGVVALALVDYEIRAADRGVALGLIAQGEGPGVDEAGVDVIRGALKSVTWLYAAGVDVDAIARLQAEDSLPGRCMAVANAMVTQALFGDILMEPWPLETDFRPLVELVDPDALEPPCLVQSARAMWAHPELAAAWRDGDDKWAHRVFATPWIRVVEMRKMMPHLPLFGLDAYGADAQPAPAR